jgi:amino acid permease
MLVKVAAAPAVLVMVVGLVAFSAVADNILKQALAEKIEVVAVAAALAVHQQELEPMVVKV